MRRCMYFELADTHIDHNIDQHIQHIITLYIAKRRSLDSPMVPHV